jgi:hypothetical protein
MHDNVDDRFHAGEAQDSTSMRTRRHKGCAFLDLECTPVPHGKRQFGRPSSRRCLGDDAAAVRGYPAKAGG